MKNESAPRGAFDRKYVLGGLTTRRPQVAFSDFQFSVNARS